MKYLSEKTKRLYDTPEECQAAEKAWEEEQAKKKAEREETARVRKERAEAVEAAFKASEEADQIAFTKRREFLKLRNEFIKDFGSFHMTVKREAPVTSPEMEDLSNLLRFFFM